MYVCTSEIVQKANELIDLCGTRDPYKIAKDIGVDIQPYIHLTSTKVLD